MLKVAKEISKLFVLQYYDFTSSGLVITLGFKRVSEYIREDIKWYTRNLDTIKYLRMTQDEFEIKRIQFQKRVKSYEQTIISLARRKNLDKLLAEGYLKMKAYIRFYDLRRLRPQTGVTPYLHHYKEGSGLGYFSGYRKQQRGSF